MNKKHKPGDTFILKQDMMVYFQGNEDVRVAVKKNTVVVFLKEDMKFALYLAFCGFGIARGWSNDFIDNKSYFKKLE